MNPIGLLARIEEIVRRSGVAATIEARLPVGVRHRQLGVATLLVGLLLALADDRPAHLVRAHRALLALEEADRWRFGVVMATQRGPHLLTYRQVEYTARLVTASLAKATADGAPTDDLQGVVDALVEASISLAVASGSSSLAVDWTDQETFARPPVAPGGHGADPEAAWGHRRGGPHKGELFFGYYFQATTMVRDEDGPAVPELVRRIAVSSCALGPVPLLVPVLARLAAQGPLTDVLCDSGYAHRTPEHWALPIRAMGAALVMDLHPADRGTKGTYQGAICHNGSLYCPATPAALFGIEPLSRQASPEEVAAHDRRSAELATDWAPSRPPIPTAATGPCARPPSARSAARPRRRPSCLPSTGLRSPRPRTSRCAVPSRPSPSTAAPTPVARPSSAATRR